MSLWERKFHFILLQTSTELLRGQKISPILSKVSSTCPKTIRGKTFTWKDFFYIHIQIFPIETKRLPKWTSTVVKAAFYASGKTFWGRKKLRARNWNFNSSSRTLSRKLSESWSKLLELFLKFHSTCPNDHFDQKRFASKKCFIFLGFWPNYSRNLTNKNPTLLQNLLSMRPELHFERKKKKYWRICNF